MVLEKRQRKIKILRIIDRLNIGGPTIHTVVLTRGLNDSMFESKLVTGIVDNWEGDMSYYAKKQGVISITVPQMRRSRTIASIIKDLIAFFCIYKIIKEERPDIVHTHKAIGGALGRTAAVLARVPIKVHTFHGHVLRGYYNHLLSEIFIWIERILARFTDKIIAISNYQLKELSYDLKIASPGKIALIPLGFELESFLKTEGQKGHLRRELKISKDTVLIGIVGRLTKIKNHEMFLRAASGILKETNKVAFIVVGGGEEAEKLKQRVNQLEIMEQVHFLDWRQDMEDIYSDLDVVVLTSFNEGTPVTLLEAMASAKPVVATAVGGVPDVVDDGETGLLVPSQDVERFTKAVLQLIADEQKRLRMGARGRKKVALKYSKARLLQDMRSLYLELIEKKKKMKKITRTKE